MVVQPLFRKLNSERILHRAYYKGNDRGIIVIEISSKTKPYYSIRPEMNKVLLSGTQSIIPEIIYELYPEEWKKVTDKRSISHFTIRKIENWLDEVYTFEETHQVTEYK